MDPVLVATRRMRPFVQSGVRQELILHWELRDEEQGTAVTGDRCETHSKRVKQPSWTCSGDGGLSTSATRIYRMHVNKIEKTGPRWDTKCYRSYFQA